MLRVLHVIGPMETGGAQTQLLGLLRAAHGNLWDAMVCGTSPGEMTEEFLAAGVPVVELRRWGSPGLIRIAKLHRTVGASGCDVVHSNLWQSNLYSRLAVAARRDRPGVVISERGLAPERRPAQRLADRLLKPWTDAWVGNSRAVVEFIESAHSLRSGTAILIPNAIDKLVFRRPAQRLWTKPLRVGTVGRLTWEKGHEVLIASCQRLVDQGVEIEVHIAGDGPRRMELEQLSSGLPVVFHGPLQPGSPVAEFLGKLDVFVLASHREGRPNAVLEALAMGVPTVVSDAPGSVEALDGGGAVVPRADAGALARAIAHVSENLDAAAERSQAAGSRILGFDELAGRYLKLFETVRRKPHTA